MHESVWEQAHHQMRDSIERWRELLKIPSVSTDPAYANELRNAASWLITLLAELGFSAELRETGGHPVVIGHNPGSGASAPHLLYYGHYDVQPPDPRELWDTDPFEPTVTEGDKGPRMVARGAVDNKGQLMTFLEAFRAWRAVHGELPVPVTVVIEGEEEIGSRHLRPFLEQHQEELAADVCIVSDTNTWNLDTPALTTRLRGLLYTEITCRGPTHDLHSGFYGGAVTNPLNALAGVLAGLHDDRGRVALPGFYDPVAAPASAEREGWEALAFDETRFLEGAGVQHGGGEADFSLLERIWARPTCDVNGMTGGYTAPGAKTVIPTHGSAKVSFRLVPYQEPDAVAASLEHYLQEATPAGCRCELEIHSGAPAIQVSVDSPYVRAAREALTIAYDRDPVLMGCGGSIPIVAWVRAILGIDTLLMGFGLEDDRMHSPNEKFELRSFENGIRSHVALLARLADLTRP